MNGRESTQSKQKRQHTNNSQPAIVVKDALVPARDEKLDSNTVQRLQADGRRTARSF